MRLLEFLRQMHHTTPQNLVFSNICMLRVFGIEPEYLQYIHMFLSPKLKHLQAAVFFGTTGTMCGMFHGFYMSSRRDFRTSDI